MQCQKTHQTAGSEDQLCGQQQGRPDKTFTVTGFIQASLSKIQGLFKDF